MNEILIYISGWITFVLCYYVYYVYIHKNNKYRNKYNLGVNKKLIIYHGIKWGVFSWFGIFVYVLIAIVSIIIYYIIELDNWIENKLT